MAKNEDPGITDWKDGFLFVGNQLALDFLNTRPVQNGEPQELLGDFKALLRWFRAAELVSSREFTNLQQWDGSSRAQRTLEEIRGLREELRKEILNWEAGGKLHHATIEKLNSLLATHPMLAKMVETNTGTQVDQYFEAQQPEDVFAPLAYGAAKLFAEAERTRVRKCGNCVLHFLDTSKKGTRRWCSMQLCGNRLKVAAYARRQRKGGDK
jgi:predicted RNA-binding Zn ribbon-like protein